MDFSEIKKLEIPQGEVTKIVDKDGNIVWRKELLKVKLLTSTTLDIVGNYIDGSYLRNTGAISVDGTWNISDYLPCEPGTLMVSSGGTAPSICFYDKDKNFLSGQNYNKVRPKEVDAPEQTEFLRWSTGSSLSLAGYVELLFSNYTELFKKALIPKIINTAGNVVDSYIVSSITYYGEVNGIPIPCEGKSKVVYSGFGAPAGRFIVCFYDSDDAPIKSSRRKPGATEGEIEVPDGACYFRASYYNTVQELLPNAFKNFTLDVK